MHGSGKESESVTISTLSHACLSRITDTYPQKLATTVVKAAPNLPPSPCSTDLRVREVVHAIHVPLTARLGPDRTVAGRPALAADTTTFNVTLVVTKACTITAAAATNVDFGTAASTTATPPWARAR